jgi:hypothetical protein
MSERLVSLRNSIEIPIAAVSGTYLLTPMPAFRIALAKFRTGSTEIFLVIFASDTALYLIWEISIATAEKSRFTARQLCRQSKYSYIAFRRQGQISLFTRLHKNAGVLLDSALRRALSLASKLSIVLEMTIIVGSNLIPAMNHYYLTFSRFANDWIVRAGLYCNIEQKQSIIDSLPNRRENFPVLRKCCQAKYCGASLMIDGHFPCFIFCLIKRFQINIETRQWDIE